MSTILDKIAEIENEMARTQKNKATAKHLGLLKAKLAKLKSELLLPKSSSKGAGDGFDVTKSGDARVGMIGFPSVGKSTLLSKLTETESAVGAYEFTTLTAVPGTVVVHGTRIQLVDLPGIIEGAKDGKGRGRQVISTGRTCDLILIVLDAMKPLTIKNIIENELSGFGIRLNKTPPDISFVKRERGGLNFTCMNSNATLDAETAHAICKEYKINNASITVRSAANAEDLIDVIEGNRVYIPALYVLNKVDGLFIEELDVITEHMPDAVPVCADHEWGLDELLERVWEKLSVTRVYTKPKGQLPDYNEPVVLRGERRSVEDFCRRIHKDFVKSFKYAWVWGKSVQHNPQRCGLSHVLEDEDIVQIVRK
ncbi:GTP-binding protein 128up [Thecamonas trahens ATCC 50062]|uniref:GTP-binding protein 128up n=1 Tax=Thecamonas trahens ATCC 50062 TaxID=461836 RepID=A0A0L0D6Z0_THETB|nr:GTP-binding protein 128up [Thecamonas trahens ATCC 50062]KNC48132.1 GTP-binding protein 128up [Thecamonas trahens ATCC 50062]|eukprot:XP_013758703.1 GTP-binding protein 128up [Thecamonas trahens ATCC 50062]